MNEATVADPSKLTVHPAAALFPMMSESELKELAADIRTNGLFSPIVVKDEQILDGRNRLRACQIAGVPARFVEWEGTGSVASWVFSVNLHRRHLTPSQRAMLAARAVEVFEMEALERQQRGVASEDRGRSHEKAAAQLEVGASSVRRAQHVLEHGVPELVAAVEAGEVPVRAAAEVVSLSREEQSALVRERKLGERVREEREKRRPARPRPPSRPASPSSELTDDADEDDDESTLDPQNRPEPQPINTSDFRTGYRKGSKPKDEAAKVDQILVAARSALHTWRWIAIEWSEDKRFDMRFALDESGPIAHHLQQAVGKLEEISAVCNGKKPAPPRERP